MRKVITHNLPARPPVNAPEKAGCFPNKTPDLTLTDMKARQASKIREIGESLITTGFISLDAQAKILGLPRSTARRILSAEDKGTGISARIICRMLRLGAAPAGCSGENNRIRKRKSSRYLRWYGEAAPHIYLEARIERPSN